MILRSRLATLLAAVVLPVAAPAQIVLSNLGTTTQSSSAINELSYWAQAFSTGAGSTWNVNSVTLSMAMANNTSGNFIVGIFSNGASQPAALVAGGWLSGTSNPAVAGDYTFTASGLELQPGTTYWIVTGVNSGLAQYRWNFANSTSYGTTVWTPVHMAAQSMDEAFTWSSGATGNPYKFAIDAAAIPEPSTYAAFAGAGLLTFAVLRRRKLSR